MTIDQAVVLVVDDEPDNFDVIEALLSPQDFQLHYVADGHQALSWLKRRQPAAVLLDVMMPGMDGITLCRAIREEPTWQAIPIIMVTALTSKTDLARCLAAGADDFISKPVNALELQARLRAMLRLYEQHQHIQKLNQSLAELNQSLTNFNQTLEERVQQKTAQLQQMIDYDPLTGLPSRAFLNRRLEALLQGRSQAQRPPRHALLHLDFQQFRLINDSLGYDIGSQLLVAISERLQQQQRPQDLLVRLGGDEFGILLADMHTPDQIDPLVQTLLESFNQPFTVAGYELFASTCIGIAFEDERHRHAADFLQDAEIAIHRAKDKGAGGCEYFQPAMYDLVSQRLRLETDLQRAIAHGEFEVFYQPIWQLDPLELAGFEALIRWQHPHQGMVSPGTFIPCLEETGLIVPVGLLVLETACRQLLAWQTQYDQSLFMSVNLSVRQFASPHLLADIDRVLQETGISPDHLKLEITESAIVDNPQEAIDLIEALRDRGMQVSLDDFGTGYSSLSNLHDFPLDVLKVDQSFVKAAEHNPRNRAILNAIITLGQALGTDIVAEGIETEQQLVNLKERGCQYGQGYWLGRPAATADLAALIERQVRAIPQQV
jgi:diguanylate cyclase (GGDEF)-like protein